MLDEGRTVERGAGVELEEALPELEGKGAAWGSHETSEEPKMLCVRHVHVGGPAQLAHDALCRGPRGDSEDVAAYVPAELVQSNADDLCLGRVHVQGHRRVPE